MNKPRVYADFQKLDGQGRAALTTRGAQGDLEAIEAILKDGLEVILYMDDADEDGKSDDLEVDGVLCYDRSAGHWVGLYDSSGFRHRSDRKP